MVSLDKLTIAFELKGTWSVDDLTSIPSTLPQGSLTQKVWGEGRLGGSVS